MSKCAYYICPAENRNALLLIKNVSINISINSYITVHSQNMPLNLIFCHTFAGMVSYFGYFY